MCLLAKFIQGVTTGGTDQISGVPYVKLYRKTPKHLYPKFNGYGDIGQRKVWTSLVSAYCDVILGVSGGLARATKIAFLRYR